MMPRDPQVRQHTSPSLYPSSNPSVHFFASLQPSTVDGRTLFKLRTKLLIILYLCKLYTFFLGFFSWSGFLGWLTIGDLGGCKGWGRLRRLWLGRFARGDADSLAALGRQHYHGLLRGHPPGGRGDRAVRGIGSDRGLGDSGGIIILYNEGVS